MTEVETTNNKRKELDEVEVDLEAPVPLSKKQKRLEKKGKKERKTPKRDRQEDLLEDDHESDKEVKEVKSQYSAWIGNLSFDTTKEDLQRFLIFKTEDNDEDEKITDENITRVHMPRGKGNKIKGFAYVDFTTSELVKAAIRLSEQNLNGRNLLIKDGKSFEGRPASGASKNPPSRILFVGNLSFDTTEDQIERMFQHCGEIVKIRMATFEDSGKCKGFTFVDFREVEAATKALGDNRCRKMNGRLLRMEYGEDRSKRTNAQKHGVGSSSREERIEEPAVYEAAQEQQEEAPKRKQRKEKGRAADDRRPKSGLVLANAQRGKVGIVQSTGKKVTFD